MMPLQYTVYKSDISYFSGKLEAYLRYKCIAHDLVDVDQAAMQRVRENTGVQKMPAIEMSDGRWLFDTTPMIRWLETQHTEASVLPDDPALAFVACLIEDYGDEWLWRPAMWWRWVPKVSRVALGRRIAAKMVSPFLAIPLGYYFARRQLKEWVWGDGVNAGNSDAVRDMFYHELDTLEAVFKQQPYLLGSHPSVADFGYFASMYRHFGNDPDSAEVMRRKGPKTYEWLARLWNARYTELASSASWVWPEADHWQGLLSRVANDYLPYLHQNAVAFRQGQQRFDYTGGSLTFSATTTTHYRVWCRQELQREFAQLSVEDQQRVNSLFASVGGLNSLHQDGVIDSGMDAQFKLPCDPVTVGSQPGLRQRVFGQPRN